MVVNLHRLGNAFMVDKPVERKQFEIPERFDTHIKGSDFEREIRVECKKVLPEGW